MRIVVTASLLFVVATLLLVNNAAGEPDAKWMRLAFAIAHKTYQFTSTRGENIAAVFVHEKAGQDPTPLVWAVNCRNKQAWQHAERLAIDTLKKKVCNSEAPCDKVWKNIVVYSTLQPCWNCGTELGSFLGGPPKAIYYGAVDIATDPNADQVQARRVFPADACYPAQPSSEDDTEEDKGKCIFTLTKETQELYLGSSQGKSQAKKEFPNMLTLVDKEKRTCPAAFYPLPLPQDRKFARLEDILNDGNTPDYLLINPRKLNRGAMDLTRQLFEAWGTPEESADQTIVSDWLSQVPADGTTDTFTTACKKCKVDEAAWFCAATGVRENCVVQMGSRAPRAKCATGWVRDCDKTL